MNIGAWCCCPEPQRSGTQAQQYYVIQTKTPIIIKNLRDDGRNVLVKQSTVTVFYILQMEYTVLVLCTQRTTACIIYLKTAINI